MKLKLTLRPRDRRSHDGRDQTISAIKLVRDCGVPLREAKQFIENAIDFHVHERRGVWISVPKLPHRFGHKLHDYGFMLIGLED